MSNSPPPETTKLQIDIQNNSSSQSSSSQSSSSNESPLDNVYTTKALEAASKVEEIGKSEKYRKVPKAMKIINVFVQMGLILIAFVNVILTVIAENSDSAGLKIYFEICAIALPAIPVFWSRLMDASKNFAGVDEYVEKTEKTEADDAPVVKKKSRKYIEEDDEEPVVKKKTRKYVEEDESDDAPVVKKKSKKYIEETESDDEDSEPIDFNKIKKNRSKTLPQLEPLEPVVDN